MFGDEGCVITPASYENNLKTLEWIDIRGYYCVAIETNDYTLQEALYNGSLYFAKHAVIKAFYLRASPIHLME